MAKKRVKDTFEHHSGIKYGAFFFLMRFCLPVPRVDTEKLPSRLFSTILKKQEITTQKLVNYSHRKIRFSGNNSTITKEKKNVVHAYLSVVSQRED